MPGFKDFVDLTVLTESDLDDYLAKQVVMKFASTAARDAALAAVLREGMIAYSDAADTYYGYDGTGWFIMSEPAQSYTPTLINITLGNGTRTGTYHRSDGYCDFEAIFTMGSTSAMGTNPELALPVAAAATRANRFSVDILDTGTTQFVGISAALAAAATTVLCYRTDATVTTVNAVSIASTGPMTWATGDILSVAGRFKMNTRYL